MKSRSSLSLLSWTIRSIFVAPLCLGSASALAVDMANIKLTIDGSRPKDWYLLRENATLTANGAVTDWIKLENNSELFLNQSTIDATASQYGLALRNSRATVVGSTIRSETLALDLGMGASAVIRDSTLHGGDIGGLVTGTAQVTLINTDLTGDSHYGFQMYGGTVNMIGGSLTGGQYGLQLGSALYENHIHLDGVQVSGEDGAILFDSFAGAHSASHVTISNGTTLSSGSDVLIDIRELAEAYVTVDNSHLVGDVVVRDEATADLTLQNHASLTGRLIGVQRLALNSAGQWNLIEDSEVGALSMNGGIVKFGETGQFLRLTTESLSGSGTFMMEADFSQGQSDFLDITGTATGSHSLQVTASGADPLNTGSLHMVSIGDGDARFDLSSGRADIGTWSYHLIQNGNDWFLVQTRETSPSTNSVLALFNSAPTVLLGELTTLRSRMGELRMDASQAGGWMRAYGNKYNVADSAGFGYKQVQQGLSMGADGVLPMAGGQWLAGVMAGYSQSDLDLSRGTSGEVDSFYLGGYATWMDQASGNYFDGVLKFNRLQNSSDVLMSDGVRAKGEYSNHALSASAELGRHIKLEDGWFAEPFTQVTAAVISGDSYSLNNGMQADGDTTYSLLGKVGATVGRSIDLASGHVLQPYLKAAWAHEFASNSHVKVNGHRFDNDLSGSRGELGAGVAMSMGERTRVHLDLDYAKGERIEQPWGVNFGVRYLW